MRDVLIVYNEPALSPDHPDYASEAGVLESVAAVRDALAGSQYRVAELGVRSLAQLLSELPNLSVPVVVFNLFEGFGGIGRGEAVVAGLFELSGFALTGSGGGCLDLVRDKARTKWLLSGAGLPTPQFVLLGAGQRMDSTVFDPLLRLGPLIVKPAHEDASLGIGLESVVGDYHALVAQVKRIQALYGAVLVEQFIAGREFNAAVLAPPEPELLPLAEIEFDATCPPAERLVTYEAKWATGSAADLATRPRCPADVPPELAERIRAVALAAFRATDCRDYARVDLRVDESGNVYILEVNGNPDIGPSAGFARALQTAGIEYREFVEGAVQNASKRTLADGIVTS